MKTRTRHQHLQRIDRVVALLQAAVEQGNELPELATLAAAAHLSPFHFHRIYRALAGETVGNTVARLRLLRALQLLAEPDGRVTEAALAVGYETPQAFARAFRQAFDTTPSDMRRQGVRLQQEIERLRQPSPGEGVAFSPLKVEVVSVEPFRLVAIRHVGDPVGLGQTYGRLFQWMAERGALEQMAGIYGVPHDDPRDVPREHCAFECALALAGEGPETVGEVHPLQLGGGLWARARHVGSYDHLDDFTDHFIADWLSDSGYTLRDAWPFRHFHDDPEETPEAVLRADIYLPVEPG
ncbi:MAG TPA: GyrI-like domain-containing protein [Dyella sp.]|uniref:AraC family transcriptional regulator n=1 Tax=Dyella sp. TaxID=1869338 RepID=UPI002D7A0418|nr:GyrI-like domain-containing protein [Dyella sp.]HET6553401.1 GyrI-like domain-containing protein [Dyella sp.]